MRTVDVVVIGAGQAGLSAGYHLRRRGFVPLDRAAPAGQTFVILDADHAPGGAWQHRWRSLRMATVNGIYELPGMPVPPADPELPARDVLPPYFAAYEQEFGLDVQRPVTVRRVTRDGDDPHGRLLVQTDGETYAARFVINATGTWNQPYVPFVHGAATFAGRQLHVHDYVSRDEFAGKRVAIVGAGVSGVQLLDEIADVASEVLWFTRAEPVWLDASAFDTATRVAAIAGVEERVRQGRPPGSVVSVTGMLWGPWAQSAERKGVLHARPMFIAIEPRGVRTPHGVLHEVDVILWATGFRAAIGHLSPLRLRTPEGGICVANGRSIDEPRLFLIGYGPSQSTVGANRAGRDAVRAIVGRAPGKASTDADAIVGATV
ncbi:NAD(P)-binding domain-containing protein [Microbacterium mitrae]|uniref:NAD(P)/FAD-dependent oxidoreductase n=1 Tax=Microbacterium mitrae TaxID=664640 RepID=A0A5C8HSA8_9MICO|nr:NAD(P)-binding domain-containing protein [Microbacterium mitrae]TXK06209.1 NAD(P)/FAD-dependent oxidoreductase [Microbacterium mitrae]